MKSEHPFVCALYNPLHTSDTQTKGQIKPNSDNRVPTLASTWKRVNQTTIWIEHKTNTPPISLAVTATDAFVFCRGFVLLLWLTLYDNRSHQSANNSGATKCAIYCVTCKEWRNQLCQMYLIDILRKYWWGIVGDCWRSI